MFTTLEQYVSAVRKFYDEALKDTTIFVAMHGQALANAVFLPRGSVVVLLTEPGNYGWKWM